MSYQSNRTGGRSGSGYSGRNGNGYNGRGMSERSHVGRVSIRSEEIGGAARADAGRPARVPREVPRENSYFGRSSAPSLGRPGRDVYRIDEVDDDYMSEYAGGYAGGYADEDEDAPRQNRRPHRRERLRSDIDRLSSTDRRSARTSAATWRSASSSWGRPRPIISLKKVIIGVVIIAVVVFAVTKLTGCMG